MAATSLAISGSAVLPAGLPALHESQAASFTSEVWEALRQALRLSSLELQIVQAVFGEQQQAAMASALHVTPFVVYRTLQRIYIKLHIGSRLELKQRVLAEYQVFAAKAHH